MNEVTATFDLKGTDGSTISSFPVTPTDTDTNNTTPRPKSNRMQWINSMNNNSGRSAPIMVIMDNTQRSPSVHSTTPIIITPSQSDTNLSNLNNIINKQNNSINDEHESEVDDDDDDDDELDDDIDDTPLLKSPNKDFLNNNNPFPLRINLKSPRIHTKNSNNKYAHKSTPHPSYKRPKPCNITISSIQHNNNNIEIERERDRNDIPNTPIPAKIKTLDENMSDNDSDSSFDNYLFADTHSYKLSNKSSKNIHARNKNNVSRTVHKNRPKNLKNICVNSPISNGLLSPIHTDTPISTNNSQIGYKIKSYHTYQTRESSLLDHEDEYDPPRGSLQLTPHPRSNGSNHNNHNIGIKNTISSPIVNGQIICSIVEEEDMNNNDESGCEIDSEYINNYLNQNHSNKSHANTTCTPFSIQRDRSRSIAIHEPIEPSNIWTDTDSISTMNTMPSTMNTMHTMTDITIQYRPKNTKKRKVLSQNLTLSDIKNKKSHEHNGSSSYFFPSPKTMYQELHGHTHGHNGHTNKPKLSLATYSSDTDEGSIIPIKPSPNSSINSSNSLNSIDTSNTNTLHTMDTSINSYNSLNSIDTFDSNYSYKYDKYANNNTGRNVKIIRRKKKNNQYRRKIHKSKYPLDFEPKLKMLSEMDTLSTSRSHSDDMSDDMTDMTDDNNNNDQQHTRGSNNDGTLHVLSSYNNDQRSSNNDTMHVLSSYIPCDISDSADLAYQEYIGTEYGVNANGESYRQSIESYRQSNISNISSSNDNSNDNYYSNVDYDYYNNNSNHSNNNNNNNNNNNRNDFNINNNNNNNNRNVFNINNKMNSQYTNVNSDHWNKYIYNQQWQKALQGAYLRGFNKGYSMGVQFKLSNGLPHH